jgi:hypothetical protein
VKIKLVIVALVAVFGLQGMENPYQDTLVQAVVKCIESGRDTGKKHPMVVHFYNDRDEQYSSSDKIQDLLAGSLKSNFDTQFAESSTIRLDSGVKDNDFVLKYLSKDHKTWISSQDYMNDTPRLRSACIVFDIVDDKSADCFLHNSERYARYGTPMLINFNTSGVKDRFNIWTILGKDVVQCGHMPANIAQILKEEKASRERFYGSLHTAEGSNAENIAEGSDVENRDPRPDNKEKKQSSSLSAFSNFFTNRLVIAGGFSLAAFLAYYYYNFVR